MKIVLSGPSDLTEFDKTEIKKYLDAVIDEHSISILAYRSIEKEVFKFFVENDKYASKLTIYTFPEFNSLSQEFQTTIDYLRKQGATHKSFYYNDMIVRRTPYMDAWRYILDENDAIVTFFDEIIHIKERKKLLIPIDMAKKIKKRPFIHDLPVHNHAFLDKKPTEKIRLIQ